MDEVSPKLNSIRDIMAALKNAKGAEYQRLYRIAQYKTAGPGTPSALDYLSAQPPSGGNVRTVTTFKWPVMQKPKWRIQWHRPKPKYPGQKTFLRQPKSQQLIRGRRVKIKPVVPSKVGKTTKVPLKVSTKKASVTTKPEGLLPIAEPAVTIPSVVQP